VEDAIADVQRSFERLCLAAGIETLSAMMEADAEAICGPRHGRVETAPSPSLGPNAGTDRLPRRQSCGGTPRVRGIDGREVALPSWNDATAEDWLGRWAMNLMLINVSDAAVRAAVRLQEGDVPEGPGSGVSKSAGKRVRLFKAVELLGGGLGLTQTAMELGYGSTSAFIYAFRTELGCSPQAYMSGRLAHRDSRNGVAR